MPDFQAAIPPLCPHASSWQTFLQSFPTTRVLNRCLSRLCGKDSHEDTVKGRHGGAATKRASQLHALLQPGLLRVLPGVPQTLNLEKDARNKQKSMSPNIRQLKRRLAVSCCQPGVDTGVSDGRTGMCRISRTITQRRRKFQHLGQSRSLSRRTGLNCQLRLHEVLVCMVTAF